MKLPALRLGSTDPVAVLMKSLCDTEFRLAQAEHEWLEAQVA